MSPAETPSNELWIVYDGACPFCSSYVLLYRLREAGIEVHLVDAREAHPIVDETRRLGLDLDRGMAVRSGGRFYHGAEAINLLAILGSGETVFNRLNRLLFRHPNWARRLYPVLVRGRLITLRMMKRRLIGET